MPCLPELNPEHNDFSERSDFRERCDFRERSDLSDFRERRL